MVVKECIQLKPETLLEIIASVANIVEEADADYKNYACLE